MSAANTIILNFSIYIFNLLYGSSRISNIFYLGVQGGFFVSGKIIL